MDIKELSDFGGSTALLPLADAVGLPIDQVNFIFCQLVALCLSFYLRANVKTPQARLWFCLISGSIITSFCFGSQIGHIIVMGGMCYAAMTLNTSSNMPWVVFAISMTYMSLLHLKRQFLEPGNYSLDITGPMMVLTQKVSSLGFSIRDGQEQKKEDAKATTLQTRYAVGRKPSLLEFSSFTFQFQSMLAGPLVMYKDFQYFIETENVPSPMSVVIRKLATSVFFAVVFVTVGPHFQASKLVDGKFFDGMSFPAQVLFIICVTTIERAKYHHAWILADAVCNASGLGYNHEKKTWDLTTNVHPFAFEGALSFKESLDHWNIGTGKWLRHVMYERTSPKIRTAATYMLSAMWHGFYPGYYITFLGGALMTSAARTVRRHIRPFFIYGRNYKIFYDIITWISARVCVGYLTFTFILLDFAPGFVVLRKIYFFLHIAAILAMVLVPKIFPAAPSLGGVRPNKEKQKSCSTLTGPDFTVKSEVDNSDAASLGTNKVNGIERNVPGGTTKMKTG